MSYRRERLGFRFPLTTLAALSAFLCALVSFLGPFDWRIYSEEGLFVFFLIEVFFIFGLAFGELIRGREASCRSSKCFVITDFQLGILLVSSILSLICFLYLASSFLDYYGTDYELGGTFYEFNQEGRGTLGRICTVLLQLGMASFLLYIPHWNKSHHLRNLVFALGFWTTAAYYALCGSRFSLVTSAIVFGVALLCRRKGSGDSDRVSSRGRAKGGKAAIAILLSLLLLFALGAITVNRMSVSSRIPENHMEFVAGDSPLKDSYKALAEEIGSLSNSIFSFADYIGEAPFVFSYLYENHFPDRAYWGAHTFRSIAQASSGIGFDYMYNESDVAAITSPNISKYSGIGFSLMVDYGPYTSFAISALFGFIFGRISGSRRGSWLSRSLFPCIAAMVVFAPVYFFTVGRLDYVVVELILVYALLVVLKPHESRFAISGSAMSSTKTRCSDVPQ